ncbi:LysR family transcriptional regulator [Phytobacter sp. V91]|uniref:LysR family transcriptional regulator n=1 Tax=Phytobacter sp. V91 TaxID=3369425 RepID=UPI003F640DCE
MTSSTSRVLLNRLMSRARLKHMQALIKLTELRSMGRAADAIGITQPAMSQLIADLEQLIEVKLFLRHTKGVEPTEITLELVKIARRMVAAAEDGAELISCMKMDNHFLRIATTAAASGALLSEVLPQFSSAYPNVHSQVTEVAGQALDACLSDNEYDLICCRKPLVIPEGWIFTPCVRDELIVVSSRDHPLANGSDATLDALQAATWLMTPVGTLARIHFEEMVAKNNWVALKQFHIISREMIIIWSIMKQAKLLALLPRSIIKPWLESRVLVELDTSIIIPLEDIGFLRKQKDYSASTALLADYMMTNIAR